MAVLPENDRIAGPYIAGPGQTDFEGDFPLIRADALRARVLTLAGVNTILSGEQLSAVAVVQNGFTCRLAAGLEAGDKVWVYSELPPERDRAHPLGGAVRTPTLEDDAMGMQAQVQELRRDLGRAALSRPGDPPLPPGGAADPEMVAEEVANQIGGALNNKANKNSTGTTVNLYGYQRSLPGLIGNQVWGPSDLGSWETDPEAYNDEALNELLGNNTQARITDQVRLLGGLLVPENTFVSMADNSDITFDRDVSFAHGRPALIFANPIGTAIDFEDGARAVGLTAIKECALGVFTSIKQVLDAIGAFSGTGIHANSRVAFECLEFTGVGFGLTGRINGCERFRVDGFKSDGLSDIHITDIFDASWFGTVSLAPLTAQAFLRWYVSPANPEFAGLDAGGQARRRWETACCNVRPDFGFKLAPLAGLGAGTGADGLNIGEVLSYGRNRAGWLQDANACMVTKLWLDNAVACIAGQADIDAFNALSAGDKAFVQAWYSKTDAERAANPGLDPYLYKWHPLWGHYQPFGSVLEGNCQNTQIDLLHADSAYTNHALLQAAGTVGPLIGIMSSGQAKNQQLLLGHGEGEINTFQYAGAVGDAVIAVSAGTGEWNIGMRGGNSAGPNIVRFANNADAPKVMIDATRWIHNGVRRAPLVVANPISAALNAGTYPIVWANVSQDRGGHLNPASGVFTASDHGWVEAEAYLPFTSASNNPTAHELLLRQNGSPLTTDPIVVATTAKEKLRIRMRVFCNKGDTLNFEVTHGGFVTWVGAEAYAHFTGVN